METHDIARSLKGHAASAGVDKWVMIQENTFRNWVNEQLRTGGMELQNLEEDFDSGVLLCALISALQGKRVRYIKAPRNHHQQLANVSDALTAIANDNIKLVNIGPEDIVNGNLKLILGLIWHLILRYQIGKSKFPTKKLMLAWLNAVVPNRDITNFTSDWNDGIALHAVIEWCRPGLCPNWKNLSRSDGLDNCRNAMTLAKQHFDIPLVVRPEDLSSSDLDELSGMTYLSYFMKFDSPGYHGTLSLVRRLLRQQATVNNFTSDWSDGRLLCKLVNAVGGNVPGFPSMSSDPVENMQNGITSAQGLGIEPILTAKQMCDPEIDHIGIMAYCVYFQSFKPVRSSSEKVIFTGLPNNCSVSQEANFSINLEDEDVSAGDIRAEVVGPESQHTVHFNWVDRSGTGYFTPSETGLHKLNVYCENEMINGCPASFKVLADRSKVTFNSVDSCSLGALTELAVNCAAAGEGEVHMEARSPTGRSMRLSAVPRHGGNYVSNFNPTEVGEWEVSVLYDGEHISGSPYNINVYDPSAVRVYNLESGLVGSALTFNADSTRAGRGDLRVTVEHDGHTVESEVYEETSGVFKINFNPDGPGAYNVGVFFNEIEVRGSPYQVDVGDSSNVTVSGDGINLVPVNRVATFEVNPNGQMGGKVAVEILSPNGGLVISSVEQQQNGSSIVSYTPKVVGDHKVTVLYRGRPVNGCPFTARVYDSSRVIVSNMPMTSMRGQPVVFDIDASKAGSGNIEIMINDGEIACSVQNHGNYRFTASFLPISTDDHRVEMKFNAYQVPGSPWKVAIMDPGNMSVKESGQDYVHIHRSAAFKVRTQQNADAGKLTARVLAPNGTLLPFRIEEETSEFRVEYTPVEVGDHQIEVKYSDHEVTGSPFVAKAYDTSAIVVSDLPNGVVGQPIEFGIDVRSAGEGQLEIMVNNGNLPNTVESEETGVYRMSFIPEVAGTQTVEIIFNKESHPDSPFQCIAVDLNKASVRSFELQLPVDREASFFISSENISQDLNATVEITSPSGRDIPVTYKKEKDGLQRVFYSPKEVGVHQVSVTYLGVHIGDSPYFFKTNNAKLVRLSKMPFGILGIPFKFRVLGELAGDGKMEVTVVTEGETIPCDLIPIGDGTFEVTFMGNGERMHTLNILFNGEPIPGSPYSINFADVDKIRIQKLSTYRVPCDHQISLKMVCAPTAFQDIVINIEGPVFNKVPHKFRSMGDGLYSLDWMPIKPGTYDIDVKYGNIIPVWGSPLQIKAFDSRKVKVFEAGYPPKVGERYLMKVDVAGAGEGDLDINIFCQGRTVQSAINKGKDDLLWLTFDLEEADLYDVYVAFNGEPVPGSPFKVDLTPRMSECRDLVPYCPRYFIVQQLQWYFLQTLGTLYPLDMVTMYITAPSGDRVNADIYRQGDGEFKVEWTPRVAGQHRVDIQFAGNQIDGSPFFVDVFDLATIRVDNFRNGIVGEDAGFSVDFSNAGTLDQEIQVVNPSGHDVVLQSNELGYLWKDFTYEPEEPGTYNIFIRYGGFQLPGCPFTQEVKDGGLPSASGPGLYFAEEDKSAHFEIDVGRRKGDLRVQVSGPNSVAKCSVEEKPDGICAVTYIPVETGMFDVSVLWNGNDIPGSPYHPKVVDARKVKVIGGWQHFMDGNERVNLVVGERKQLPFDVAEAGPGVFRAEVQGPSRAIDVDLDTHTMGRTSVDFIPEEEGNHYIHLFWSDIPLVNSPFLGYAVRAHADPSKLILTGRGLKEAVVREEAEFLIDGSQAGKGNPEVVLSGVRAEVNVKTVPIGNGKYKCSYVAMVPGAYLLHITWNGRQLRGSPYKVNVIGAFYPNKVVVSGEGLKGGNLGHRMDVRIDTRKAGPGELTAYCMGPHQVAYCELEDDRDGTFRLGIKAQEPGRHVLQVKYSGEHVQGSPFIFKVMSQPDASKVRVTGPGVEHGILATFLSRFTVETRGAGSGQLTVRIRGPKGGFQVEMYRDSQRDRTILCRYDPTECGLYILSIKWSGVDVPGSPFKVNILDTQEELEQALHDTSYSIGTVNSMPPQSYRSFNGQAPVPRMVYSQWRDNM